MFRKRRIQVGIGPQKHFRTERFRMVMGDPQAHVGGQIGVYFGIVVGAGDNEIAA
ncbi:hypothetical protein D1872_316520 [compost metagenome]